MTRYNVTVRWMDDTEEVYPVAECMVRDGELVLTENDSYAARSDRTHIPLNSVRVWKVEHA